MAPTSAKSLDTSVLRGVSGSSKLQSPNAAPYTLCRAITNRKAVKTQDSFPPGKENFLPFHLFISIFIFIFGIIISSGTIFLRISAWFLFLSNLWNRDSHPCPWNGGKEEDSGRMLILPGKELFSWGTAISTTFFFKTPEFWLQKNKSYFTFHQYNILWLESHSRTFWWITVSNVIHPATKKSIEFYSWPNKIQHSENTNSFTLDRKYSFRVKF